MIQSVDQFFAKSAPYLAAFTAWCHAMRPAATADHLCYKCGSTEEFKRLRMLFEHPTQSTFIFQSEIVGRPIALVRLATPMWTALGEITLLELADQKPNGSQKAGFDHIEIFPKANGMDALALALNNKGANFTFVRRKHHSTYDAKIHGDFKVRLEPEPLLDHIRNNEFR